MPNAAAAKKTSRSTATRAVPAKGSAAKATAAKASPAKKATAAKTVAKKAPVKAGVVKAGVKKAPAKVAATKAAATKAPAKTATKQTAAKAPAKATAKAKATTAPKAAPAKAPAKAASTAAPAEAPAEAATKAPAAAKKPAKRSNTVICPLSGFEVKPEKPGLSAKTLERLEASLLEERARHVQSAAELAAEAEQLAAEREGGDTQFDEESGEGDTINIERERDLLLSASAQQIVDEIDRALERIAAGTYGLCVPAGRRIHLERLEALPYAETCVDCKARAERRR
jgi:RNA polymerase-binding transcription factor DksA